LETKKKEEKIKEKVLHISETMKLMEEELDLTIIKVTKPIKKTKTIPINPISQEAEPNNFMDVPPPPPKIDSEIETSRYGIPATKIDPNPKKKIEFSSLNSHHSHNQPYSSLLSRHENSFFNGSNFNNSDFQPPPQKIMKQTAYSQPSVNLPPNQNSQPQINEYQPSFAKKTFSVPLHHPPQQITILKDPLNPPSSPNQYRKNSNSIAYQNKISNANTKPSTNSNVQINQNQISNSTINNKSSYQQINPPNVKSVTPTSNVQINQNQSSNSTINKNEYQKINQNPTSSNIFVTPQIHNDINTSLKRKASDLFVTPQINNDINASLKRKASEAELETSQSKKEKQSEVVILDSDSD